MESIYIGLIVYYWAYGTPQGEYPAGVPRAAIITEIPRTDDLAATGPAVGLAVLNPTGLFFNREVPFGPGQPGHWGYLPA